MLNNECLKVKFDRDVRDTLTLPSFWEPTEPCNWNVVNYLIELYEKDPILSKRTAHKYLLKDVTFLQHLVLSDTVAEDMLYAMCSFKKTRSRRAALKMFYSECVDDIKKSSLKKRAAKTSMKATMMMEASFDEEERARKKIKTKETATSEDEGKCKTEPFCDN